MNAIDNILRAYSVRNPTIGYCQGFNFIVGRLLLVVNEEVSINWIKYLGSVLDVLYDHWNNDASWLLLKYGRRSYWLEGI